MIPPPIWNEVARAELRAIDAPVALFLLKALTRFLEIRRGDVKALTGAWKGCYRLRIGDYRVVFVPRGETIEILRVAHRSAVYDR